MGKLSNELARIEAGERAQAAAERTKALAAYRELAQRADAPRKGDLATIRKVLLTLDLSAQEFQSDVNALREHSELADFILPPAKLKEMQDEHAAWRAGEEKKIAAVQAEWSALAAELQSLQSGSANMQGTALKAAGQRAQAIMPQMDELQTRLRDLRAAYERAAAYRYLEIERVKGAHTNAVNRRLDLEKAHPRVLDYSGIPSIPPAATTPERRQGPLFNPKFAIPALEVPPPKQGAVCLGISG